MTQHQLATGRIATMIKLAVAAGAKVSSAFVAFALTALVTRNLPNDQAGLFLLGFTILAVFSVVVRLGLDNVVLRFLSAHGLDEYAQEKLNRAILWVATVSLPVTALAMALSRPIAEHVFNKPDFGPVLFWMLPALPAIALFYLVSLAFQSQHRVILTTLFQNLGISGLFVMGLGYAWYAYPEQLTVLLLAKIYSGAAVIVLVSAFTLWLSQNDSRLTLVGYKDSEMTSAAMNLWTASLMSLSVQWAGVLIAGTMLPAEEVALLSAAQRTALLLSFVLLVVNMVVAPHFARLWKDGDVARIKYIAKWSVRGMVVVVTPLLAVMITFSERIMSLFGEGFDEAALLLTVMASGQFINVVTGSVGLLLTMSGHEREFNQVTLFSGPTTIMLTVILTNYFGIFGTAVATAIGIAIQNIGATVLVKRRLGFFLFI
ncbi:lipopolysaccharide biosynthesis protein [Thalassolituus sp. UBA2590]|uniref:lipopolysaccharide biosynthesis protein n=1 Tax=Thalassolituus sp. UBA2590 TaxID=1947663 RepID=UPI002648E5EF|nr:oligosaccharide flippase family protein [Thalassolituus sp. UBA2590]